jgi:hypothetical protein
VTEADGPSILAKVVAMPEVQGVAKICAGGWKGVAGERAGHILGGNRPWLQACPTSDGFVPRLEPWRWILEPKGISKQAMEVRV